MVAPVPAPSSARPRAMLDQPSKAEESAPRAPRRAVLRAICAVTAMAGMPASLRAEAPAPGSNRATDPARNMLAQPGDLLVAFENGGSGAIVNPGDVKRDSGPLLAWPFDPATKIVRSGSRLDLVLLMRFDPASLSPAERARAADGIVAYTAVCPHQGCWVTDWLTSKQVLQCPCHQSQYDPRRGAAVVSGPAPRPLPALPLRLVDGRLEVKDRFTDRVGAERVSG
jgi:rieske iron-sulfur protein